MKRRISACMTDANANSEIAAVAQNDADTSVASVKKTVGRSRKTASPASAKPKPSSAAKASRVLQAPAVVMAETLAPKSSPRRRATASKPRVAPSPAPDIKDLTMDMSATFSGFQDAVGQAQAKAQAAFEKSSAIFGEAGEFTKGNVEAVIESSKILADGVQEMGTTLASEGRNAFEAITGDIKELAAAKSPADFLKLQAEITRKNIDGMVATSAKNSEALLKLMGDAFSPLSGRINVAMDKAREVSPLAAFWNKAA